MITQTKPPVHRVGVPRDEEPFHRVILQLGLSIADRNPTDTASRGQTL